MDPPEPFSSAEGGADRTPPRPASPALAAASSTPVPTSSNTPPAFNTALAAATAIAAAANTTPSGTPAPLQLDMTVTAAVSALVHHLVQPLAVHYSHSKLMALRKRLASLLTAACTPTWNESNPHSGSGSRSLISDHLIGLPPLLATAAADSDVGTAVWAKAIAAGRRRKPDNDDEDAEWEVWCDPGMVVWRWGGWSWDEAEFDPVKRSRESYQVIWQAAPTAPPPVADPTSPLATTTPLRASKAIPIRAPSLLHNHLSTPSPATTPTQDIVTSPLANTSSIPTNGLPSPPAPPRLMGLPTFPSEIREFAPRTMAMRSVSQPLPHAFIRSTPAQHKGTESTSSHSSDTSESNSHTQLLTPASRPGSADILPDGDHGHGHGNHHHHHKARRSASREATPEADDKRSSEPTTPSGTNAASGPTVTPYDGGNVTVLGGGTKLGGSRPASTVSSRGDRTRSPSVSIASRALATAVGPNSNGGGGGATSPTSAASGMASPNGNGHGNGNGGARKVRTRRRIIPTHIGYFGQPGVGAPMMGAFGSMQPVIKTGQPGGYPWPGLPQQQHGAGVGVGVAPPPVGGLGMAAQVGVPLAKRA